ncbi:MAG: ATP-binding protein [Parvibaculum sp.]
MSGLRSLTLRICLILAGALFFILLAIFVAIYVQNTNASYRGFRLPLPEQISAMVEFLESASPEEQNLFLRAANSSSMTVRVVAKAPDTTETVRLPNVTRLLTNYLDKLGGRHVYAMVDIAHGRIGEGVSERAGVFWAMRPVRLLVELRDGRTLVVEVTGELFARLTGLRLALLVLIVSIMIGGISLWAVQRQIKPLRQLALAVDVFGAQLEIPPLPDEGAKEVRQLIGAIERMQARIRDLVNGRTRILAAIGHDLGTYLTRLRLRAEFIGDARQRESAIRDIEDMHALMADTLTLAKLENAGELMTPVDLGAIVRRQVESLANAGERVTHDLDEEPCRVMGRPVALGRLVGNLLSNALKYGKAAEVSLMREGQIVRLIVADRGPGIPPEERQSVLEPFYRRDGARNLDTGGFGLGLAIVADIVQRHNGHIALMDREGGGLIVRVDLPCAPPGRDGQSPDAATA